MSPVLHLRALDACVIHVGDSEIGPDAELIFALLLHLALERGKRIPRERVSDLLWPGAAEDNARHCLRQTLYKVRQLGVPVESTASHLHLAADAVTRDFDILFTSAAYDDGGDTLPDFSEFLPGYAPRLSEGFSEWLDQQRTYVQAGLRRALLAAIHVGRSRGNWVETEALARRCLALDPLNEEATLALAEAAALSGAKAEALRILDHYMSELGPGATQIRLPAAILRKRIQ